MFKGAAISQFRHLQNRRKRFEMFANHLDRILKTIEFDTPPHSFVTGDTSLPRALVMVTSDEGFLGEYNGAVINFALNQRRKGDELIVLGERGSRYLEDMQESFVFFPGVGEEISYQGAEKLRDYFVSQYLKKSIGEIALIYARFIAFGSYEVSMLPLLPCDFLFQKEEKKFDRVSTKRATTFTRQKVGYCLNWLNRFLRRDWDRRERSCSMFRNASRF